MEERARLPRGATELVPVGDHQADVGERVAGRRELPVEHRARRTVLAEDDVVEPVVAVDQHRLPLVRQQRAQALGQLVDQRQLARLRRVPLLRPAAQLAAGEALRPPHVAEPDGVEVDGVQPGQRRGEAQAGGPARLRPQSLRRSDRVQDHPARVVHHEERRSQHLLVLA